MARFTGNLTLDGGSVVNETIASGAAIDADKMQHVYKAGTNFGFAIGATPTTREEIVFVGSTTGTIRTFNALLNVDGSSTSITFDLKKNGSSILTSVITITNSTGDRVVTSATISNTAVADGDVFSIAMTVSSSTGAQGPYAWMEVEENTAP